MAGKTISTDGGNSTDSKEKSGMKGINKKKGGNQARTQAQNIQARKNVTKQQIARELSCIPQDARIRRGQDPQVPVAPVDTEAIDKMLNHLQSLAPF
uniref:Uncharacterized protein n=1 Tax=Panagrolaimus sp. PS1159 TaxID=55785 RepID=A0AC35GJM1_9BILA